LVTDEIRFGRKMTKLPGGGLEFGEGLAAALRREWKEELNLEIRVGDIFYVNPFLQISAFNQNDEVLCHYFHIEPLQPLEIPTAQRPFEFEREEEGAQLFRWISLAELNENTFTFPIDQSLVPKLKEYGGIRDRV
jgi:8-oxo-dGTP diphosphatase